MKSKIMIYFIICLLVEFSSCSNNQSKNESDKISKESSQKISDSDKIENIKDCEKFIDQYEKWMNNYIKMIDKYLKNPTDAVLLSEYLKLSQEASEWINEWNSKLYYCANKDKYQERFEEITDKAEKKLKDLGIE